MVSTYMHLLPFSFYLNLGFPALFLLFPPTLYILSSSYRLCFELTCSHSSKHLPFFVVSTCFCMCKCVIAPFRWLSVYLFVVPEECCDVSFLLLSVPHILYAPAESGVEPLHTTQLGLEVRKGKSEAASMI
ncbi:hypothetical protein VIGAN_04303400 [Vigna angularis var. angularis]|uniref:Uncharacterized protein n=1 Tax=Vigna angularis var. angularis TaxID=157739 RepID=A0A0S3RY03_PHAAN|nr:hypothetical protein VIGAN_04303400 [Vigna angularis var. angularis]